MGKKLSENILSHMTKIERSLLIYLEWCLVDNRGRIRSSHMNKDDEKILTLWNDNDFVKTGRICLDDYSSSLGERWVELSKSAWEAAHLERKLRSRRMLEARRWKKTEEV